MDWNRNEKGDASRAGNLYPRRGRTGKKFAGSSKQAQRLSYHQIKMLPAWKRIFKRKHGRWPSDEEIWAAAHQRGSFGQDVDDFVCKTPTVIIGHGLTEGSKHGLKAISRWLDEEKIKKEKKDEELRIEKEKEDREVRRLTLLMQSPIPHTILRRVLRGDADADSLPMIFGVDRARVDELLLAMTGAMAR